MQVAEWRATRRAGAEQLASNAAAVLGQAGLSTTVAIEEGAPKRVMVELSRRMNADCVFVGATGAGDTGSRLLGGVATAVVMQARCSVEVVREQTPVAD